VKIQVLLKSNKNNGYFTCRRCYIYFNMSLNYSKIINISDREYRENQNTRFAFNNFFFENRAVYEIMWKNVVKPDWKDYPVIRHVRFACWITKRAHTQNIQYNSYCFFTTTLVSRKRFNVTLHVGQHCLSGRMRDGVCLLCGTIRRFKNK
jgi:hypothetical protein